MNSSLNYLFGGGLKRDIQAGLGDLKYLIQLGEKSVTQEQEIQAAIADLKASQAAEFKAIDDALAALEAKLARQPGPFPALGDIDLTQEIADIRAVTQANADKTAALGNAGEAVDTSTAPTTTATEGSGESTPA